MNTMVVAGEFQTANNCLSDICSDIEEGQLSNEDKEVLKKMVAVNRANQLDNRSVSGNGSLRSGDSSTESTSATNDSPTELADESEDLWATWAHLVKNWETESKKQPQLIRDLVRQGIPNYFRTLAWQLLSGANQAPAHDAYAEYLRSNSPHEKAIRRDISQYRLRELYKPTMAELGLCMFQLECLVQDQMPELHAHFQNMGFDTSMYASSWFLTLFSTQLPLDIAFRILDLLLIDKISIAFRIALAILQLCRIDLLTLDMEGMLRYFQRDVAEKFENDPERLFSVAFGIKCNPKLMKKLEKDYWVKRSKDQEEAIELRGIRTENRLLRQRVECLEQESASLADRLIDKQVALAQETEKLINLTHDMSSLRELHSEIKKQLEEAYETVRDLTSKRAVDRLDIAVQADDACMIEHIQTLQQELMQSQVRETDQELLIKELKNRINELETANKRLKEAPPDNCVASIQEDLIAVKMREAEANLSLKEVRQKLVDLSNDWKSKRYSGNFFQREAYIEREWTTMCCHFQLHTAMELPEPLEGLEKRPVVVKEQACTPARMKELEDLLMGVRIREAETLGQLKEMRQRVMELETLNHVCTNQIRRQDEEFKRLTLEHEQCSFKERDHQQNLLEERRRTSDLESQLKELTVMSRLKETELMQANAELKAKICELESGLMERWTREELDRSNAAADTSSEGEQESADANLHAAVVNGDRCPPSLGSLLLSSLSSEDDLDNLVTKVSVDIDSSVFSSPTSEISPNIGATASNQGESCNG
ncbi:Ecotropic viral integration site 5 -like protein [Trichinella nativa]|uniref:Ecotropic viral integration site 5-like protein n=1 Tax=Trichinella nativa TaxID=6335 RepID=A0A0V1L045_9BILA|nr:Ecotropic viral integration site 5 -like protein [Trichinella nativa]